MPVDYDAVVVDIVADVVVCCLGQELDNMKANHVEDLAGGCRIMVAPLAVVVVIITMFFGCCCCCWWRCCVCWLSLFFFLLLLLFSFVAVVVEVVIQSLAG